MSPAARPDALAMPTHRAFTAAARLLEAHYVGCGRCRAEREPCGEGRKRWEVVLDVHRDVLLECVGWHHAHRRGTARASEMLGKMLRVVRLMERARQDGTAAPVRHAKRSR